MPGRASDVARLAALVGDDVLRITDPASGWPALGELTVDHQRVPVALYVGPVGLTQRGRDHIERRFQNPGSRRPIVDQRPDRQPLLLGLWETDPLVSVKQPMVVSADPIARIDRMTRYSVFASMAVLLRALETGWDEGTNSSGELVRCFLPPLLPVSYLADRDGASPESVAMRAVIEGSGLLTEAEPDVPEPAARARRGGTVLVRDARFSRRVVDAYGHRCAMCGLAVGLVQGAHIYPAAAPSSHDEPWNGLALCANHHLAFDRHLLAVRPETGEIVFHRTLLEQVDRNPAVRAFVDGTFGELKRPAGRAAQPRREMFERRYSFFAGQYDWV